MRTAPNKGKIKDQKFMAPVDCEEADVPESVPGMPEDACEEGSSKNRSEPDRASSSGILPSNLPTPDMSEFPNLVVIQGGDPELQTLSGEEMAEVLGILAGKGGE